MAQGEDPGRMLGPRAERGQVAWSVLLNGVLVAAFVLGLIPIVAIVHGFVELVQQSQIRSGADWEDLVPPGVARLIRERNVISA